MDDIIDRHRKACEGFSAIVRLADGCWENPSPCSELNARDVVEHVMGFHDVLLLRPMETKPTHPKGDPVARWTVTVPAIFSAMDLASSVGSEEVSKSSDLHLDRLLPMLTTDVLVHTWDLARAVGVDPQLDPELCEVSYETVRPNDERLRASGMFDPALAVPAGADVNSRLVTFLGRNPEWTP